jgi:hypothetical protein
MFETAPTPPPWRSIHPISSATRPGRTRGEGLFERLAKVGFYDAGALDRQPRLSLAAWYARQQQVGRVAPASGRVLAARSLSDTTRVPAAFEAERRRFVGRVRRGVASWQFSKQRGPSHVTLPFVFERE